MKRFLQKKISLSLSLVLILVTMGGTWGITYLNVQPEEVSAVSAEPAETVQMQYDDAVKDSMTVEENEILPLVSLEKGAPYAKYDEEGRVLLVNFNKYPESYPEGQDVALSWGNIWAFNVAELADWYADHGKEVTDWPTRIRQLLGLAPDNDYTHFTAMWVEPEDVERPAYVQDTGTVEMTDYLTENVDEDFREWFDDNIIWCYFDGAYPWTRLGYTYDWADNGEEYGLSEFLVKEDSRVKVEYTVTIEELIAMLEAGTCQ